MREELHYTVGQVSKWLDLSPQTLRKYDKNGVLPARWTESHQRYYLEKDIQDYLDSKDNIICNQRISLVDFARLIKVSKEYLRELDFNGILPAHRTLTDYRYYTKADFFKYMNKCTLNANNNILQLQFVGEEWNYDNLEIPRIYRLKEFASELGVTPATLRRWNSNNTFKLNSRPNGTYFCTQYDLDYIHSKQAELKHKAYSKFNN